MDKLTCLHDSHLALGAVMSPFAGFDMPIRYPAGIIAEHNAVRTKVGMFDVSHMGEIFVDGPDATRFVNHIFTNDITKAAEGEILYGMMLYPDGGVVDDLLVYKGFTPEHYLLVVNAANIDKDYEWLLRNSEGFDVVLDNQSEAWGQIAIQGPESEDVVTRVLGIPAAAELRFYTWFELPGMIVSRTGYTGEDGFEIYSPVEKTRELWQTLLDAGVQPCGLGCRDTLRFEAGLPLYGDELSEEISPVMAGLSIFCKLDKEEFIGKDALVRQKAEGTARKLVGLEVKDRAIPRAGYSVETPEGEVVGVVTTGYHSITLDRSLAFALVDSSKGALGTELRVRIRNKVFPAEVIKKRFYQTNYKK